MTCKAFTLIELLVVITIIVVLLALLTPALDKAIYQAELTVCGASQNATIKGLSSYALNYKRSYPHRPTATDDNALINQLNSGGGEADDRIALEGFVDLKLLVDPLGEAVRLDADSNSSDSYVYASYALWHGWEFAGQAGMKRLGNRFSWVDTTQSPAMTYRVNWLVTDFDAISPSWPVTQGSHPDHDGLLFNGVAQSGDHDGDNPVVLAANVIGAVTYSFWTSGFGGGFERGDIEMNKGSADGSVTRFNDVAYKGDERMGRAPTSPGKQPTDDDWQNIPIR